MEVPEPPSPQAPSRRPEDLADVIKGALTLFTVVACAGFVLAQFHPDLLLSDTTPSGGDMGAHVWAPAYLRDNLLSQWRIAGWTSDWYAGFPAMQFYMVLPMLAIVFLSYFVPYGVAFKLVTVSGAVTLPVACYLFGRLTRQRFPVPAFLAVAGTVFVFDRSFSIYGGNAASTLAGEFAFSISLSLAIVYLGVVGRGLADGRRRALAAGLLALTGLCHLIPAFFAISGTVVWFLAWSGRDLFEVAGSLEPDRWSTMWRSMRGRLLWLATMAPVAGLLAAFWVLPFYAKSNYLNDMGWQKDEHYFDYLFWRHGLTGGGLVDYPTLALVLALAILGTVVAISMRSRAGVFLVGVAGLTATAFVYVPQGRLWNTRLLPFYYLSLLLLAAVGLGLLPAVLGRERLRRGVGLLAAAGMLAIQALVLLRPAALAWIHVDQTPMTTDVYWGERWYPYYYVALLVAVAVAAVELVSARAEVRRAVAWSLIGSAVVVQLVMRTDDSLRGGTRLMGYAVAVLFLVVLVAVREILELARRRGRDLPTWTAPALRFTAFMFVVLGIWLYLALPLRALGPLASVDATTGEYRFLGLAAVGTRDDSFVDSWAAWNYAGYESTCAPERGDTCDRGEKPYYSEYHAVVKTMKDIAAEHGCGRAMWEYSSELDRYGTPMALMLLPHWTDGCIGSMEGLYFEASTSTPYHFINQDELSLNGSNAQRGMPYGAGSPTPDDFDRGIRHLQMFGVRYYMAYTDEMTKLARAHPALTELATAPSMCLDENCPPDLEDRPVRWVIFQVAESELVEPLGYEPVVLTGVGGGHTCETVPIEEDDRGRKCEGWLDPAVDWYMEPELWDVRLAADGPDGWARIPVDEWMENHEAPRSELDPVEVSDIASGTQTISFTVDQVGIPVLVKTSYFPNWEVTGADGPYRVTPNLMVVVPTEERVELSYGWTRVDIAGWLLTVAGVALLVVLARRPAVKIGPGPVAVWRVPDGTPVG